MKPITAAIISCSTALINAQGLFNMSNLYALDEDNSPLQYAVGVRYGYDDNTQPIGSNSPGGLEIGSSYLSGDIKAGFSHNESNYTLTAYAKAGLIHYLDDDAANNSTNGLLNAGLNLSYRLNDRIRLSTRNYFNYGFEPDYERGIAEDRRSSLYTSYSSHNDIGVRWSERTGTVHGISIHGADYDNGNNYNTVTFYNQLRYRLTPRTVLLGSYNYGSQDLSDTHTYSAGLEHSLGDRTGVSLQAGYTMLEQDGGETANSPFVNASIRHTVSERFSVTGFASYNVDDNFTQVATGTSGNELQYARFNTRRNLRAGVRGNYLINETVSLFGGVSVVNSSYKGLSSGTSSSDEVDLLLYNLNAGFRYGITNSLSIVGSYNYTNSSSDDSQPFEYSRNRYSIGVEASF